MKGQRGAVLLIVLWTTLLLTVLVTSMAGRVRLTAATVANNQGAGLRWATLMGVVSQAEMELMLERMPPPPGFPVQLSQSGETRIPAYRFNGRTLQLNYPAPLDVVVRIYDHAGKINLNQIPRTAMQLLIQNRLGGEDEADPEQVEELLDAWSDWTDVNDLPGVNGAERDYYEEQEPGFLPRDNPELDTVEEILHIRGFAELFEGVNLDAAFTVYGNNRTVNLNLATREAMRLLPGLDEELIENILAYRELEDLNNQIELGEIVPFENMQLLSQWIGTNTSNVYSVFVYPQVERQPQPEDEEDEFINPDPVTQAYMQIVEINSYNALPVVYKVDPYGRLPDTGPPRVREEDLLFDPDDLGQR